MNAHKKITQHAEGFVEEFEVAQVRLAGGLTISAQPKCYTDETIRQIPVPIDAIRVPL